jgi:hypothetical protein
MKNRAFKQFRGLAVQLKAVVVAKTCNEIITLDKFTTQ